MCLKGMTLVETDGGTNLFLGSLGKRNAELVPWSQHVTLGPTAVCRCPMTEAEL